MRANRLAAEVFYNYVSNYITNYLVNKLISDTLCSKPKNTMKNRLLVLLLLTVLINSVFAQSPHLLQLGERKEIESQVLGETRQYYVQLPQGYDRDRPARYPVAYLLDGEVLLPALHTVHQFYSGGFIPEMVLIGIDNSQNRNRDLTTSSVEMLYGQPARNTTGKADKFLEFLRTELIPHIENNYPVTGYRTLIGHSYGGLFTLYALLQTPELFANYLAIDPSLDWDNQHLYKVAKESERLKRLQNKSLFISLNGQLHMQDPSVTIDNVMEDQSFFTQFARANMTFTNLLREEAAEGLDLHWKFYPNDLHGTIPLPSIMDGLIAMFAWFQMENTHKFNDFETPVATLEGIIKNRAQKLEAHFGYAVPPYPEDLVNAMGKPQKARMFLDHYLQYFPQQAAAYEAMADYYERQQESSKALEFAQKALDISGSEHHRKQVERLKN